MCARVGRHGELGEDALRVLLDRNQLSHKAILERSVARIAARGRFSSRRARRSL
ncbi:MAG: hypothetical protein L0H93_20885 [Nocardioides sp.]|nr:hypothetical protein [Nocardioides sp.]